MHMCENIWKWIMYTKKIGSWYVITRYFLNTSENAIDFWSSILKKIFLDFFENFIYFYLRLSLLVVSSVMKKFICHVLYKNVCHKYTNVIWFLKKIKCTKLHDDVTYFYVL